jgi:hypothetical protein
MPFSVTAFDHRAWARHGLKDYGDFAECIGECNQREMADHTSGEWFFIDEDVLPPMQGVDYEGKPANEKAIYFGTWGNDNAPGADSYTYAEIFDMDDKDDRAAYAARRAEWERAPEWLTEYETCARCAETFDKDIMTEVDGRYYCERHVPEEE